MDAIGLLALLIFVGLVGWAIGWVMGEREGYDRSTDEWLREPKKRDFKKPEGG